MEPGSLVKIKEIDANITQDRGKIAIVTSITLNEDGRVCKLYYFNYHGYRFNEYHEGRLEVINAIH